ncbi:hypothetical protein BP6252_02948 [Coleophoma cylindrospora]|uniref:Rhodopsin domain-containing protein n=1 Tax=Coleophoma cylindrospora TaxID=1849047 RepID=A0A3D8S6F2_9HELO|nr:hypothetical protein BP6252_02948 [Coleophoma cylindrospora]
MSNFLLEVWVEFGLAAAIIFIRIAVRLHVVGIRGFRGDDYLSVVILISSMAASNDCSSCYHYHWDFTTTSHSCQTSSSVPLTIFFCNLVSDLCLLAFPIPVLITVIKMRLPLSRKLILGAILCTGIFTIATSIIVVVKYTTTDDRIGPASWTKRELFLWVIILNTPSILSVFKDKILPDESSQNRSDVHLQIEETKLMP